MLSEVSHGWPLVTLASLARVKRGASPRPIQDPKWFSDQGHGWVRISDVTASDRVLLRTTQYLSDIGRAASVEIVPGDLIMSICATIGRPLFSGIHACIHDGFVAFKEIDRSRLDPDYLYFFLQGQTQHFEAQSQPGTQRNLNSSLVATTEIPLPPIDEQRRIAEVLRSVDEAIEAADALAQQAQTLWHSLTESLIWQLQTDSPASVRPLGNAVWASDYGVNAPLGNEPIGYAVLRMGNLQDGWIDRTDLKWGEIADREAHALALEVGDILFNRTNSRDLVGKVALVREPTNDLYASYIVRLRINRDVADPHYLFAVMHSRRAQAQFKSIATPGVSQSNINPTNLKKQLIPLPSLSEQQEISAQLQAVEGARRSALKELAAVRRIKADLISDLLSGRVRVPA
ncbi:restriction endonuclease subunit S [Sphingomonas sp. LB-2]|uniref:restriction endonuclease subunit S n=1 Tax=Sphingomonas caeni TaxID=2984949 RepID=UPI00223064E2|nr:restriction endonuclease subunit S [Sphingomonas caeni]MCW3848114.1 restriction endonuclease subunit S [Sphingomonas caeni]